MQHHPVCLFANSVTGSAKDVNKMQRSHEPNISSIHMHVAAFHVLIYALCHRCVTWKGSSALSTSILQSSMRLISRPSPAYFCLGSIQQVGFIRFTVPLGTLPLLMLCSCFRATQDLFWGLGTMLVLMLHSCFKVNTGSSFALRVLAEVPMSDT